MSRLLLALMVSAALNELRIGHAARQLQETDWSITEIAGDAGRPVEFQPPVLRADAMQPARVPAGARDILGQPRLTNCFSLGKQATAGD
ncbi:MAG: hypothetical protein ACREIA_24465 [Opitutaceae bacterium]